MKIIGNTKEFIQLSELDSKPCTIFDNPEPSSLTILWFKTDDNHFVIDGEDYTFARNQIVFLTEFHKVKALTKGDSNFLRFNRSFYCIIDHDAEVSCKGILFFGASQLPVITIPDEKFDALVKLTKQITLNKGRVDDATLEAFFEAGYTK